MKLTSLFISLVLLFSACSKDEATTDPTNNGVSYISMKVNGAVWKSTEIGVASGIVGGNYIGSASKKVGDKSESISIIIDNINTSGTNTLNKDSDGIIGFLNADLGLSWSIGDGSPGSAIFKITKAKTVSGVTLASATFSGSTTDSNGNAVVITDGVVFNAAVE